MSAPKKPYQKSVVSLDYEAVLRRFGEIASFDYPFPIPDQTKPRDRDTRVDLNSWNNIRPVLLGLFLFFGKNLSPPLTLFFGILSRCFEADSLSSSVLRALASICLVQIVCFDVFFVHWLTDGKLGGLGYSDGRPPTEGIICNEAVPRNVRIRERLRKVASYRPTPYLYSGDLLTLLPFLRFKGSLGERVSYRRWWIRVPSAPAPDGDDGPFRRPSGGDDDEAVALDVAFPSSGYRADRPAFLVSHGLNGGSTEAYVLDFARRATREGSTVAVMINRGLMKTPVRGMNIFHGARTSDIGCAVDALHYALGGERGGREAKPQNAKIILLGFSMGGMLVNNYAAKTGEKSGLVAALSFSGSICNEKILRPSPTTSHGRSVWQPLLAWGLKGTVMRPNMPKLVKRGITAAEVEKIRTVKDIDSDMVCRYNGYPTIHHYYEDMSAGGKGDAKGIKKLHNIEIPLLAVHAIDDPIVNYEAACEEEVAKTNSVLLLSTKHGGHIGWPMGFYPSSNRFKFMMDVAMEFASSVVQEI